MTESSLNQSYNALAQRFDDHAQLTWLKTPTSDLKHDCMRELMLATRLLGTEQPATNSGNLIERSWEYTVGDTRMKLAFQAMTGEGNTQLGGFQFKLISSETGFEKVLMNGFDSRTFDGTTGDESKPTAHVSMAKGYEPIAKLHQAITEQWRSSDVGSINYLYQRAVRQDLQ